MRAAAQSRHQRVAGSASSRSGAMGRPQFSQSPYRPVHTRSTAASISVSCVRARSSEAASCSRSKAVVEPSGSCSRRCWRRRWPPERHRGHATDRRCRPRRGPELGEQLLRVAHAAPSTAWSSASADAATARCRSGRRCAGAPRDARGPVVPAGRCSPRSGRAPAPPARTGDPSIPRPRPGRGRATGRRTTDARARPHRWRPQPCRGWRRRWTIGRRWRRQRLQQRARLVQVAALRVGEGEQVADQQWAAAHRREVGDQFGRPALQVAQDDGREQGVTHHDRLPQLVAAGELLRSVDAVPVGLQGEHGPGGRHAHDLGERLAPLGVQVRQPDVRVGAERQAEQFGVVQAAGEREHFGGRRLGAGRRRGRWSRGRGRAAAGNVARPSARVIAAGAR